MRRVRLSRAMWIVLAIAVVALVVARLLLAGWVADYLNRRMARMGDYRGYVASVDLHLWRGAYSMNGLRIEKRTGKVPVPLLNAPRTDIDVSWRALLHGAVVARVVFDRPELNFVDDASDAATQSGKGVNWRAELESLIPIRLDEVNVLDGRVHFRNFHSDPPVDLEWTSVDGTVTNLSNARKASSRAATLDLDARMLGNAPVDVHAKFDPLGSLRDFELAIKVTHVDLARANSFLQAYAKVDAESGSGDFVMELEARKGRLDGYAKPLLHEVKLFSWKHDIEEQHDNPLRAAWEALAGGVENLFKNQKEDQFATRVEIHGTIESRETSTLQAIGAVLHNAFVQAFRPQFERLPEKRD
ncbi:MAG TPA: DUF748 domain-containing protein [Rhodanobacteraceae bacterium]|jgi:hypothetical protein|nr:DUF748 domain-containing protein [Rhodanobacteraceae bacterium]